MGIEKLESVFLPNSKYLAPHSFLCDLSSPSMECHPYAVVHAWHVCMRLIRTNTTQLTTDMYLQVSMMAGASHPTWLAKRLAVANFATFSFHLLYTHRKPHLWPCIAARGQSQTCRIPSFNFNPSQIVVSHWWWEQSTCTHDGRCNGFAQKNHKDPAASSHPSRRKWWQWRTVRT